MNISHVDQHVLLQLDIATLSDRRPSVYQPGMELGQLLIQSLKHTITYAEVSDEIFLLLDIIPNVELPSNVLFLS